MSISEILTQAYGEPSYWAEQQLDALIRQDRRERLVRLSSQMRLLPLTCDHDATECQCKREYVLPLEAIEAELQRGAESGEA